MTTRLNKYYYYTSQYLSPSASTTSLVDELCIRLALTAL